MRSFILSRCFLLCCQSLFLGPVKRPVHQRGSERGEKCCGKAYRYSADDSRSGLSQKRIGCPFAYCAPQQWPLHVWQKYPCRTWNHTLTTMSATSCIYIYIYITSALSSQPISTSHPAFSFAPALQDASSFSSFLFPITCRPARNAAPHVFPRYPHRSIPTSLLVGCLRIPRECTFSSWLGFDEHLFGIS